MKLSLLPPMLPKTQDWRWAKLLLALGFLLVVCAGVGLVIFPRTGTTIAWIAGALLCFAFAYKGRSEQLERLLQRAPSNPHPSSLDAIGLATEAFAHEMKNAVTVLRGYAELAERAAQEEGTSERVRELVTELEHQAGRMARDLKSFLDLAGRGADVTQRPLADAFREVAKLLAPLARIKNLELLVEAPEHVDRLVWEPDFRQALLNLGLNAVSFARHTVRFELRPAGDQIVVNVEDDGLGVPAEKEMLLFTTRESERPGGTGLGLMQVRTAVEKEGGTVHHERVAPTGARFVVKLPTSAPEEEHHEGPVTF